MHLLFVSSCSVQGFFPITATSCTVKVWWPWHRTAQTLTPLWTGNALQRQRCCVRAPPSSLVLCTSLSLWTRCSTREGSENRRPWWEADTSLGERKEKVYLLLSAFLCFRPPRPSPRPLCPVFSELCEQKSRRGCYCGWMEGRMRFGVGRQSRRWRETKRGGGKSVVGGMEWIRKWEEKTSGGLGFL